MATAVEGTQAVCTGYSLQARCLSLLPCACYYLQTGKNSETRKLGFGTLLLGSGGSACRANSWQANLMPCIIYIPVHLLGHAASLRDAFCCYGTFFCGFPGASGCRRLRPGTVTASTSSCWRPNREQSKQCGTNSIYYAALCEPARQTALGSLCMQLHLTRCTVSV